MQILEAEGRKFQVIRTINLEKFNSEEDAKKFLEGSVYLRQQNSNLIFIVDEIKDATFEDVVELKTEISASGSFNKTEAPRIGENVDIKI